MIKRLLLSSILAVKLASPSNVEELLEDEIQINEFNDDDTSLTGSITEFFKNLFKVEASDPEEIDIAEDTDYRKMPMLLAVQKKAENTYKNVVVYEGHFNNTECRLFVPYEGFTSLSVIDGVLANVGNSSVTGRILYGDNEIDVNEYDTYSYILQPVYNSPSNVYRYGSYNYQRHYYVQNNGIAYSDTYGKFYVDDVHIYYNDSSRTYYGLLGILLALSLIIMRRK